MPGAIVICCPADLITYSATTRYILREYGADTIFEKRPIEGSIVHLDPTVTKQPNHHVFLMITRSTNRDPLFNETLHVCLGNLIELLLENTIHEIHFPIIDPERPNNNLYTWYYCLMDYFADTSIDVYLHDRVYVSIAAILAFPSDIPLDEFSPERSLDGRREVPNPNYQTTLLSSRFFAIQSRLPDVTRGSDRLKVNKVKIKSDCRM